MSSTQRLTTLLTLLVIAASGAVACGNSVQGNAQKSPPTADAGDLQPGNYPTTPRPDLGKAGAEGHLVEARRMAEFMVWPFEIDPELTAGGGVTPGSFTSPVREADSIGAILDVTMPEGAKAHFVTGFTAQRANEGAFKKEIQTMVVRYASPDDAAHAVAELSTNATKLPFLASDPPITTRPTEIPRHSETAALTWESYGNSLVLAYTAHGPYALIQQTASNEGVAAAAELAAKTLDKQAPLIDSFQATPVDKLADLPLDPDGLLARTLEPAEDQRTVTRLGLYGPHGFLAYSSAPAEDQKLLDEAGVDAVAIFGDDVYRARDNAGAKHVIDGFADYYSTVADDIDGVPNLPESRCFKAVSNPDSEYSSVHYTCLATADRYAIETHSPQKLAAYQKTAAQYLLLTAQ